DRPQHLLARQGRPQDPAAGAAGATGVRRIWAILGDARGRALLHEPALFPAARGRRPARPVARLAGAPDARRCPALPAPAAEPGAVPRADRADYDQLHDRADLAVSVGRHRHAAGRAGADACGLRREVFRRPDRTIYLAVRVARAGAGRLWPGAGL